MTAPFLRRFLVICAFLAASTAVSYGVWRYAYLQALNQLSRQGAADLALASDRLVGQLQRYRELAVLLADHPVVERLARGEVDGAEALFLRAADITGALDVMYVDAGGVLRAAAHARVPMSLAAENYVVRAAQGALGWGHGVGAPLAPRSFYHAAPVFGVDGRVSGSVVVAASLTALEDEWRGGFRPVFFTDSEGRVFVSNRSELVGWTRPDGVPGLVAADGTRHQFDSYRSGPHEVWQMAWGPYLPRNALHLARDLPTIGLLGETLVDVAPARRLALLQGAVVAALCLAFGVLLFFAAERRQALARINAALEIRVERRTRALSQTNAALRREVEEREQAQAALARAQADLVQAGKLSALGQMSAGISHELNQPLMAIRSYAENAVQFQARGEPQRVADNLARISEMARRMGRIIQNLRAFSRQEAEPMKRVDLVGILGDAAEMVAGRARDMGVEMRVSMPAEPVWVKGGEVRLGQVFVNLMTNALDAMSESAERRLGLTLALDAPLRVEVRDTGKGVEMPQKVFDPFYSTKNVGAAEGMGLGLSISYGIIKSFGGEIRVRNCAPGALFVVELQPWEEQDAA